MNTRIVMLDKGSFESIISPQDAGAAASGAAPRAGAAARAGAAPRVGAAPRATETSLELIARVMPAAKARCGRHLRKNDGSASDPPSTLVLDILFREYLKYLRQYQFRYKLSTGSSFWTTATIGSPAGNCQTVASNFLYLLWAFGFREEDLGMQIVEIEHPKNEKIVTKHRFNLIPANLCATDAHLLGENRGTRSFKVNTESNAIEPLFPARNPFLFHAISYVKSGGYYRYYDARTGMKYVNGATDLFEGYRKGENLEFAQAARRGPSLLGALSLVSTPAFFDPKRPQRRMYLLPETFDRHQTVAAAVGDYTDGGNWIFVDELDWAGRIAPPGTAPPHVKKMFEFSRGR